MMKLKIVLYLTISKIWRKMIKEFTGKGGETWTWEETPEVTEALKQLHDRVRRAKLKEQDDQLNYDTGGK